MKHWRYTSAIAGAASVLALTGAAWAASATQADFDACNREAQAQSPAASPGSTSSTGRDASGGVQAGTSGTAGSSTSGTMGSGTSAGSGSTATGSGTTGSGSTMGSGSTAAGSGTTGSGTTTGSGSTGTSSGISGSPSGDERLQGMAAAGHSDQAYQQAYRDCMQRRGF
jgi:hypothetical protein